MRIHWQFAAVAGVILATASAPPRLLADDAKPKRKLPNILWITSEDHGPHLGCYGDKLARTPNIDKLAARGMRYRMCWSNAPVCAPARTTIISGLYPTSTGAEHMRSLVALPAEFSMFPALLRRLGYYCSNRVKEDYNLKKVGIVWDDSSAKAHYRNRPAGMPFFAVFNSTKSHESQLRGYTLPTITDPAKVRVPAYHPDVPEVRNDWARYYDVVSLVDADAGVLLRELEELGLLEDTIIFYFSDHGSGMPRSKRTPLNSGLQVPMITYYPEKWKHLAPPEYRAGGVSDRLISFVDLAPTLLSLTGEPAPKWMQGRAFAGKHIQKASEFLHGFRGRMDERYDLQRSVTDGRYVYLRNYMPHLPAGQHLEYQMQTNTTAVWKKLFDTSNLSPAQRGFWMAPRDPEELYDLESDPDEVKNLALSKAHQKILGELRTANLEHMKAIRDLGLLPEDEIHRRSAGTTPYAMGQDPAQYPLEKILEVAEAGRVMTMSVAVKLAPEARHTDSAVRYWAAIHGQTVTTGLKDESPSVQVIHAESQARSPDNQRADTGLHTLIDLAGARQPSIYIRLAALNALDRLGDKARPGLATIKSWPTDVPKDDRAAAGIPRLIHKIVKQLEK